MYTITDLYDLDHTIAKDYLKGLVEDNYSILIYTEATNPATLTLAVIDEEQTRDSGEDAEKTDQGIRQSEPGGG